MPHHLPTAGCIQLASNDEAWTPGRARSDRCDPCLESRALDWCFKILRQAIYDPIEAEKTNE